MLIINNDLYNNIKNKITNKNFFLKCGLGIVESKYVSKFSISAKLNDSTNEYDARDDGPIFSF